MASSNDNVSMALFCDFENVALGVRDANYDKFDIKPVLERLLLKGNIVVKKAYCDWDRYKAFKAPMHEANFELIEIPHVRQSGKNSADIRMVVDALDMCYTKSHVDTFVIISGDSDFSPLVSKLRENAKKVIGVGVKQSTSDLLVANCDEFIFYDDLVRESRRAKRESSSEASKPAVKRSPEEERSRRDEMDKRRNQAVEIAVNTFEALVLERGDSGKIWASVLKEAIKRRKPDFSESYYGFRTFGNLIEECKARGLLEFGRDEKSGAYVYRSSGSSSGALQGGSDMNNGDNAGNDAQEGGKQESRRSRGRGRTAAERFADREAERLAQQAGNADADTDVDDEDGDDAEAPVYSGPYHVFAQSQSEPDVQPEAQPESQLESQPTPAPESDRNRGRGRGTRGGRKQGERQGGQAAIAAAVAPVATEMAIDSPDQPDQPYVAEARDEARVDPRNKPRGKARNNARNTIPDVAGGEARNEASNEAPDAARNEARNEARNNAPDEADNETATAAPVTDEAPAPGKKKSGPKPPARKVKAAAKPVAEEAKPARDGRGRNAGAAEQAATASPEAPAAAPAAAPAQAPAPARAPAPRPASQAFDVDAVAAAAEPAATEPAAAEPAAAKPKAPAKPRKPAPRTPRPAKAVAGSDE